MPTTELSGGICPASAASSPYIARAAVPGHVSNCVRPCCSMLFSASGRITANSEDNSDAAPLRTAGLTAENVTSPTLLYSVITA